MTISAYGNEALNPEEILSYEIGYIGKDNERFKWSANVFYNEYTNFIRTAQQTFLYAAGPFAGLPSEVRSSFVNAGKANGVGGEAGCEMLIAAGLTGEVNYSYMQVTDTADNLSTAAVNEKDVVRTDVPKHKVNLALKADIGSSVNAMVWAHWVDKVTWLIRDTGGNEHFADVDAYTTVNAQARYAVGKNSSISLAVTNILNTPYYEYPVGVNLPDASSSSIGRTLSATIRYMF